MEESEPEKEKTLTLYVVDTSHLNRRDLTRFLTDFLLFRATQTSRIIQPVVPNRQNAVFLHINTSNGYQKMASIPSMRRIEKDMSSPAWGMFGAYGTNHTSNLQHISIYNLNSEFVTDFANLYFEDNRIEALAFLANHEIMQNATEVEFDNKELTDSKCPMNRYIQLVIYAQLTFLTTPQDERTSLRSLSNYDYGFNEFLKWRQSKDSTITYIRQSKLDKLKKRPKEVIDFVGEIDHVHNTYIASAIKMDEAHRHINRLMSMLKEDKFIQIHQGLEETYLDITSPKIEELQIEFHKVQIKHPKLCYSISMQVPEKIWQRIKE